MEDCAHGFPQGLGCDECGHAQVEETIVEKPKPKPRKRKPRGKRKKTFEAKLVKRNKPARPDSTEPVMMFLGVKHFVNGAVYGPGRCLVPYEHLNAVRENEAANVSEERKLREPKACLIVRGPRNYRTVSVDPSFFESADGLQYAPTA